MYLISLLNAGINLFGPEAVIAGQVSRQARRIASSDGSGRGPIAAARVWVCMSSTALSRGMADASRWCHLLRVVHALSSSFPSGIRPRICL